MIPPTLRRPLKSKTKLIFSPHQSDLGCARGGLKFRHCLIGGAHLEPGHVRISSLLPLLIRRAVIGGKGGSIACGNGNSRTTKHGTTRI